MTKTRTQRNAPTLNVSKNALGVSQHRVEELTTQIESGNLTVGNNYITSNLSKRQLKNNEVVVTASDSPEAKRGEWIPAGGGGSQMTKSGVSSGASNSQLSVGAIAHGGSFSKKASVASSGGGGSAGSNVERLAPEVYSPLFTMANLNLPRDRITVNSWVRNFYKLHPIVRNAINLHATYPISKLNLKCSDRKVLQFFEDMIEEMDMMTTLGDVSLEYWLMGECFPYAELNETTGKWRQIIIQNPDYILVKKSILAMEPIILLRPDKKLQELVMSNNPADMQLRKQIPEKILYHVRNGQSIPLDNFNITHLKMLSAPYDVYGTSIVVSIFKDLSLFDKLRECYSIDTEVLTEVGFKFYSEISQEDKIATFNPNTNKLEYHNYLDRINYNYEGEMINFIGKKIDVCVTPNHRMWLSQSKSHGGYFDFDFIEANKLKPGFIYRSRSITEFDGETPEYVEVLGKKVPIELYLKVLGYLISEGNIHYNEDKYNYFITLCQSLVSTSYNNMKEAFFKFGETIGEYVGERNHINNSGFSKTKSCEMTNWRISNKNLTKYFSEEIGTISHNKKIPLWAKKLSPRLLKILLDALVEGDGSEIDSKYECGSTSYRYNTISKQLADDVQEIVFKCGFAPNLINAKNGQGTEFYLVTWSDSNYGRFPNIYINAKKDGVNGGGGTTNKVPYNGEVFCFTVPNGLFVTRRNGKITIQGNCKFAQADGMVNPITIVKVGGSTDGDYRATQEDIEYFRQMFEEAQYDKDFKLITHAGVDVVRVGAQGTTLDVTADIELIIKNIYTGLMVPQAVVDTDSSVYASASIGLEVLRQRYFNFRTIMAKWLTKKIFAPISEIQEFYEYKNGEKKLIVPEVEWNQMNLYDLQDYITNITGLVSTKQASLQTLYRSLGLNYQEERIRMRQESIDGAIKMREEEALSKMTLTELRGLDPEKEIMEPVDDQERAAEAMPPEAGGGMPGGDMPGGMPGGLEMPGELAPPPSMELGGGGAPGAPEGGTPPTPIV